MHQYATETDSAPLHKCSAARAKSPELSLFFQPTSLVPPVPSRWPPQGCDARHIPQPACLRSRAYRAPRPAGVLGHHCSYASVVAGLRVASGFARKACAWTASARQRSPSSNSRHTQPFGSCVVRIALLARQSRPAADQGLVADVDLAGVGRGRRAGWLVRKLQSGRTEGLDDGEHRRRGRRPPRPARRACAGGGSCGPRHRGR